MKRFVVRRAAFSLLVVFGVVTMAFIVTHLFGDPARIMLPLEASEEDYQALRHGFGLDRPISAQYGQFLSQVLHGDLGRSLWQNQPSGQVVRERLPATLMLAVIAFIWALLIAVPLGVSAALRPGSWTDRLCNMVSLGGMSIADFWLGMMLIAGLSVSLKLLPTSGYGTWKHMVLPAMTLATRPMGRIAQMCRSAMLDEMAQPYIRAVRAKGVSYHRTAYVHALKNAMLGVVTMSGLELAEMIVGYAVVVETVFGWPGIGSLAVGAFEHHDLPLIQAVVVFSALVVVVVNIAVDAAYAMLNPRIRYA